MKTTIVDAITGNTDSRGNSTIEVDVELKTAS
jgi:hypothetical protein